ncbi:hypothetical protein L7F22_057427 [Adiantum nelumboides]|nr:hypothetical protein [Adiantum nelumboides]
MAMASSAAASNVACASSPSPAFPSAPSSFQGEKLSWRPSSLRPGVLLHRRHGRLLSVVEAKVREIFMPALSSTMTEGKIVSWVKSEGDRLSKGESVVVVESDKADMDVETFYDGILAAIVVGDGEVAPVGAAIGILAENEEDVAEAKSKAAAAGGANSGAAPAAVPPPAPIPEPPSPKLVEPSVSAEPKVSTAPRVSAPIVSSMHPASEGGKRIVASPYAKKLAKDLKVDLATIIGSGPSGRIVAADVEAAAAVTPVQAPVVTSPLKPQTPVVSPSPSIVTGTSVPFSTMQNAVSRNMVDSLAIPTFRVGYTMVTDELDALYKKIKSKGVTMTALLAKATALALVQHPTVNAVCKDGKGFTFNNSINIAVAVAMDGGLITPVLQDADKMDLYSLSRRWKELVDKARAKQLQPHEYTTGTFTLSNLGMFGVDRFDAILPPGTGAIMAVGASQPTVVATSDGLFGVKSQMQVNVTADHRIIYGADLAAFLQTLAKIIEKPKDLTF